MSDRYSHSALLNQYFANSGFECHRDTHAAPPLLRLTLERAGTISILPDTDVSFPDSKSLMP
ncbi:hypothetical protein H1P_4350001 [Hyella patelloides LEGE 07179]|uniref:Uncharacterized protein n=1 Tax=Hyella patelloides LEGE 07179 TaxID=945734 RepID=A0A563VY17_9CYAN|nr:hypothetical protein [Hyella patelloides]VEP16316.1 hypothetical protein H1P_4350001 [Hyella patelloides LEGE 07179]